MVYGDALSASFAPQECIPHSWETFSSLFVSQGCCRALMGNVISHFATEVADEGVVRVEEERKCGRWKSRAPLRHIRPSVQGLCTSWQVLSAFIFRKAIGLGEFLDAFRFIDQDDYLAAGSSVGGLNHISETDTRNVRAVFAAIFLFPFTQRIVEGLGDHVHLIVGPSAEVQMQHWIFNPVLLQRGDRQSVKEFLFPWKYASIVEISRLLPNRLGRPRT